MDQQRAQRLALELMREHGLLDAGWTFQWSRAKRQLGAAQVKQTKDRRTGRTVVTRTIRLSAYLVVLNDEAEVRDTILHEIAHAIAGVENGHNEAWKRVCRRIGARPERLADETVNVIQARFAIVCGRCRRTLGQRYRRPTPERLRRAYCTHCGRDSVGMLRLEDRTAGAPQWG